MQVSLIQDSVIATFSSRTATDAEIREAGVHFKRHAFRDSASKQQKGKSTQTSYYRQKMQHVLSLGSPAGCGLEKSEHISR